MQEFKLIVAGGRDFTDYEKAKEEITRLAEGELSEYGVSIVSGMARGADALAVRFARELGITLYEFPADWNTHGKGAGFKRNADMAQAADGLLAFWDGHSTGTDHMIRTMRALKKPVRVIRYGEGVPAGRVAEVQWGRTGGYQCSSKGDKRFSALYAVMPDGRTIEMHYQCDVKGYQPGGRDWRLGKGKPPKNQVLDLYPPYLALWKVWAEHHPDLIDELRSKAAQAGNRLSDCFASTPINQARALADILNGK